MDGESNNSNYTTYKTLVHGTANPCVSEDLISNDDVLLLPYSSGTTGVPKGVMVTSGNLKAHILQIAVDELGFYKPPVSGRFSFRIFYTGISIFFYSLCSMKPKHLIGLILDTYQPVTLLILPLYHIFACQVSMRMLRACHKLVVMPQFTADNLINALEKYQVILF